MLVLDCSRFSGVPDYAALRAEGAEEVIPRLASGVDEVDALADEQVAEARAAGVRCRSGYGYVRSWRDGAAQAEFMFEQACQVRGLLLWADFEKVLKGERPTDAPALYRVTAHAFLRRWIELTGVRCGVYGPVYFLDEMALDPDLCGPLWAAHVGVATPKPARPWGGAFVLHQYAHNQPGGREGAVVDWSRTDLSCEQLWEALASGAWGPVATP